MQTPAKEGFLVRPENENTNGKAENEQMKKRIEQRRLQCRENELQAIQNKGLTSDESELPISNDNEELA
jgi:hypothetical protein